MELSPRRLIRRPFVGGFYLEKPMDVNLTYLLGSLFIAVCTGLSEEGEQMARDVLLQAANVKSLSDYEAHILRVIATRAADEVPEPARPIRPQLSVVQGGAA